VTLSIDFDGRGIIFVPISKTFTYTASPNGTAVVVSAATEAGNLQIGMSGGTRIVLTLGNFITAYRAADIRVTFGFSQPVEVPVARLRASDKSLTRFEIVSPSAVAPGLVSVTVSSTIQPSNIGRFDVLYTDDRIPEVLEGYAPYLHYATGGSNMTAVVTLLQGVPLSSIQMVFRQGTTYTVTSQPLATESIPTSTNEAVSLTFAVPAGSPGVMSVRIRVGTTVFKTSSAFTIELVPVPSAPPVIVAYSPSTGPNTGGTPVSVIIKDMLAITDASLLRVQVSLGDAQSTLAFGGDIVFLESTILQTSLRFLMPSFLLGGDARLTVFTIGREELNATATFRYIDVRVASLLYAYPSVGKANIATSIEVSVARFGAIIGPTGMSIRAGTADAGATTLSVASYQVRDDGSTLFRISALRASGVPGPVNISLRNCPRFAECPDKTVTFPFFFRDPFQPFILSFSPAFSYSDGRVPVTLDIESLPIALQPNDLVRTVGINVNRYRYAYDVRTPAHVTCTYCIK
jgi:hypothetical protein